MPYSVLFVYCCDECYFDVFVSVWMHAVTQVILECVNKTIECRQSKYIAKHGSSAMYVFEGSLFAEYLFEAEYYYGCRYLFKIVSCETYRK